MDGFQECINGATTSDTSLDIFKKKKNIFLLGLINLILMNTQY